MSARRLFHRVSKTENASTTPTDTDEPQKPKVPDLDQIQDDPDQTKEKAKEKGAEYIPHPMYVTELRYHFKGVILREAKLKPRINQELPSQPHILEVVRSIQSDLQSYSDDWEMKKAMEVGVTSLPVLCILSPIRAVCTYIPEAILVHGPRLPHTLALLVHHRNELEAYKLVTSSELSQEEIEERSKHIDGAFTVIDAEHGAELEVEDEQQSQDPPVTIFKNYWIHLKLGSVVYKSQHGVLSAYVVHSVTGGSDDDDDDDRDEQ